MSMSYMSYIDFVTLCLLNSFAKECIPGLARAQGGHKDQPGELVHMLACASGMDYFLVYNDIH